MKNPIEEKRFESISDEFMYEIQDVVELLTYVFGEKTNKHSIIDLVKNYANRPANDNWPIYESKCNKVGEVSAK